MKSYQKFANYGFFAARRASMQADLQGFCALYGDLKPPRRFEAAPDDALGASGRHTREGAARAGLSA